MLDRRYQVFITTSGKEMQPERAVVVQTLMGMGFFSCGLESRTPLSCAHARRQIDECDYVLLLLGSQYGEQSVSGIGYMHLEYIYAVTKQKPIVVFMHAHPEYRDVQLQEHCEKVKEKFNDFRQQLQHEVAQTAYFKNLRDLELGLRSNMTQMLVRYPTLGWVRPQNLQVLHDEIDRLKVKLAHVKLQQDQSLLDQSTSLPQVSIDEIFSFDYRMHAYQDQHVKEIVVMKQTTWAELLLLLSQDFQYPFPEAYFSKLMNDYLSRKALQDAQTELPRAHAVASVQINIRALSTIKQQMRQNEWIVPVGHDDRQRMLWQITRMGQTLLGDVAQVDQA